MLGKILDWLEQAPADEKTPVTPELAAAALMIEIMAADHQWDDVEESHILVLLKGTLGLDHDAAAELVKEARQQVHDTPDLFRFTRQINDHYSEDDKYRLMVNLWQVAYADGDVHRYEDYMVRKISELLYIPHSQFIRAKHEAQAGGQGGNAPTKPDH